MNLLKKFSNFIQQEKLFSSNDRLLLAVSGGLDSVVLCALCKQAGYQFEIAHCNFQLRGNDSIRDEQFVKQLAQKYGVLCHVKIFDTTTYAANTKKSIEEAARDLRYGWFHELLQNSQVSQQQLQSEKTGTSLKYILTAHHADDNIETVTMNFFRGTGITGLKGILPRQGKIIRPLLFARRAELELFVQESALEFVTDDTNFETVYTRNYFRNIILPQVNKVYPATSNNILANIQRFREAEIIYQQAIAVHKKKLIEVKGEEIHIPVLKLERATPLATIVYEIIKDYGFTAHQTNETIALLRSESGKYILSNTHRILKNRNWLIISPLQAVAAAHVLIEANDSLVAFNNGTIQIKKMVHGELTIANNPVIAQLDLAAIQFPLLLRKWKQGDYFYPLGMQKKKKLSRFFIDQKLSLLQKEGSWVIEMNKKITWIVGLRIDDRFKITPATKEMLVLHYLPK